MRASILIAGTALALTGCGDNGQSGNAANIDQSLSAGAITSNDVTAIDAVTGADANMAADVNYLDAADDTGNGTGNASAKGSKPAKSTASGDAASGPTASPSAPAGNAATPATTNNAT